MGHHLEIDASDHTLAITEAARAYVAIQRRGVTTVADRMQAWDRLTAAVDAERAAQGPACTCPETDPAVRERRASGQLDAAATTITARWTPEGEAR